MSDLRQKFLAAATAPATRTVDVPGVGAVAVRGLTGAEYDQYEAACSVTAGGEVSFRANRALLVRLAAVVDGGGPLFTAADDAFLQTLPAGVLVPLATAVLELSGLTKAAQEAVAKN